MNFKVNVKFVDPEAEALEKERETAFWLAVLSYVEPFFLWFVIRYMMGWALTGFDSIGLLIGLVVIRFISKFRMFVYPIAWGGVVYLFSSGRLLPWWIDVLGILLVVGGRFWLLFSERKGKDDAYELDEREGIEG